MPRSPSRSSTVLPEVEGRPPGYDLATVLAGTAAFIAVSEAFPTSVRSTALGLTYSLAVSTLGGTTQFVVAWLTKVAGSSLAPAWYMFAACLVGLAAMVALRETAPRFTGRA